ncbi:MAG: IS66 family transposase [bacterium]|nr:IS66 family transposase [bacterium]
MPPISQDALSILHGWHDQQQPLVRALSTPMVGEMTAALGVVQEVMDQQEAALGEVLTRMESLEQTSKAVLEASKAQVADLTAKLQATTDRIGVLERKQFGRQSEKRKTPDAKRAARKRRRNELTDEEKKARREAAAAKRQEKLDALRTVQHTVVLPQSIGPGREMPPVTSVVYEWHPGELVRVEVSREQCATPDGCIVTAPPVAQVVEGGIYGPALYAKICSDKCLNAMPLRRQERAFARLGAPLPGSTLSVLFHRAAELVKPIYDALLAHVSSSPHVSADETPMPVLDEHATRTGWMWVFATADALLFTHSPSRGKSVPEAVLGTTTGTLTVDGYTAYHSVTGGTGRKRGGCWSHARRGLYDVRHHDQAVIQPILDDIGELFYIEELAKDNGIRETAEHLALRTNKSQPIITRLFDALENYNANVVDGRASVTKAVRYILNQRGPLQLFLTDAAVPIHNNLSERALRVIALMRKNSLFAGNDEAAQRFAQLLSLLGTCRLHDLDPEVWLADVLLAISEPGLIASDLLPWNWKLTRGPKCQPYYDTT